MVLRGASKRWGEKKEGGGCQQADSTHVNHLFSSSWFNHNPITNAKCAYTFQTLYTTIRWLIVNLTTPVGTANGLTCRIRMPALRVCTVKERVTSESSAGGEGVRGITDSFSAEANKCNGMTTSDKERKGAHQKQRGSVTADEEVPVPRRRE